MGHKVHPNAFRLGVYRSWEANWFADRKDYTKLLHEDLDMRRLILRRLRNAGIAKIETERSSNAQMTVTIHTAKPGIVIGKGGASVDQLREDLEKRFGNRVRISIQEIKQPEMDAQLVAENIASQIERRISYRRAMKQSILRTMRSGAKGIRVHLGGRLRGSEMARREWDREGRVPLHTLRADIDFGRATAKTTFGVIGVKVWIYKNLVALPTRGGLQQVLSAEDVVAGAPTPTGAGRPAPVVPSGTDSVPEVAPDAPRVEEATVEAQVAAEETPTATRRRAAPGRGRAAEPGPAPTPEPRADGDGIGEPANDPGPAVPAADEGEPGASS